MAGSKTGQVESRKNAFFEDKSENENVHSVIHKTAVAPDSIGWSQQAFFETLGHERHKVGSDERNAEQEYLLQGMVKGAMFEAAEIAGKSNVGIAARPTGVLAHQGIESRNPTKAQEYKNKTSKEEDLFLCDELKWEDIGAVVHYNPRVGWSSATAKRQAASGQRTHLEKDASEAEWEEKKTHIQQNRLPELEKLQKKLKFWPSEAGH